MTQSKNKAWFARALVPALFIIGTMIGCLAEFRPEAIGALGNLALPGIFISLCFNIGPHGSTKLFLWVWPLCNGVAYAGPVGFALWLRSKISNRGRTR